MKRRPRFVEPAVTTEEMRAHLLTLEKERLVDILMLRAEWDPRLRSDLVVETARGKSSHGELDVQALRRSIDQATDTGGGVDWRGATSYAHGVENAIDALEALFEQGHDNQLMTLLDLVEYALARVEERTGDVDDDGDMGIVFERLQALHLAVCLRARPSPVALAKRLFDWERKSEWGSFHRCKETYAEALGAAGIAEYERLALAAGAHR